MKSFGVLPGLRLHERLVELLGQIDFTVHGGHLLLIIHQLLTTDLLHVAVVIVQSFHFRLCFLEAKSLGDQACLQLLILLSQPCIVEFVLTLYLVDLDVLQGFQFNLLLLQSRNRLSSRAVPVQDIHLTLLVLALQIFIQGLYVFVQSFDVPFKLFDNELQLVFLPFLLFFLTNKSSFSVLEISFCRCTVFDESLPFFLISFFFIIKGLSFIFHLCINFFEVLFKLSLCLVKLFVQFFKFRIFDFIASSQLGDLLSHKRNIVAVLRGEAFLFYFYLVEAMMEILQFPSVEIARFLQPVKKSCDSVFPFLDFILELDQVSFVVLLFFIFQPVLLPQKVLELAFVNPQGLDYLLVSLVKVLQVSCMNFQQFMPEVEELLLSLSLDSVNLILKQCDFSLQRLTIVTMVACLSFDFFKKLANFLVFD